MKCYYHDEREANFKCVECGKHLCKECIENDNGKIICKECAGLESYNEDIKKKEEIVSNKNQEYSSDKIVYNNYSEVNRNPNSFWTFIFSLIPGAGHMYLGLMKRGFQLMIAFFGLIIIPNVIDFLGILNLLTIVVWFYSVFDAYHIKKRINKGEKVKDELIIDMSFENINYYHVGIILLVLGSLALLNEGLYSTEYIFDISRMNTIFKIFRFIRKITLPIILIVGGVMLVKRSKNY